LAFDEHRDVARRDPREVREELAHPRRTPAQVAEAVGRRLLAIDALGEKVDREDGVAELKMRGARYDGVVNAKPGEKHAVRGTFVADADPAWDGLDGAMAARDGLVQQDEVVVGRASDPENAAHEFRRDARTGAADDRDAGLEVRDLFRDIGRFPEDE